jgi:uncharacterized membrane protein YphA (DoxX/SURF4 family)
MNTILWVLQVFLAGTFVYSGIMKSTQQREKLMRIGQTGVADFSYPLIRFIGVIEILGALGIILPQALGVLPVLTPVTATGFAVVMILAAPIHVKRKEFLSFSFNLFLLLISVFVAIQRFKLS